MFILQNQNSANKQKPKIAVTTGDPAGIGPEIVYKALSSDALDNVEVVVVGPLFEPESTNAVQNVEMGKVSAEGGRIAYDSIKRAVDMAMNGEVDAVATAPINKESLKAAGIPYIGHTEIFGALTNTKNPLTMFETGDLRVFFLSRHLSIKDMLSCITKDNIVECAKQSFKALQQLGIQSGTMAIAGLNPHCGEHGLFGSEEVDEIMPAVKLLQNEGYNVAGPIGADSVFHQAAAGKFNSVLSLYHDQGHIATKTLNFYKTISLTCGMPFLRTSVDHGTAFDIAGKGVASEVSMVEAILTAAKYCKVH